MSLFTRLLVCISALCQLTACGAAGATDSLPPAPLPLELHGLSHAIAPLGARLGVQGRQLQGVTELWISGMPQEAFIIESDTRILLQRVDAQTPLGPGELLLVGSQGERVSLALWIIELELVPRVVAHGSSPLIRQSALPQGFAQSNVRARLADQEVSLQAQSTERAVLGPIADALKPGWTWLDVQIDDEWLAPVPVAVVHLLIHEVDSDTPGVDRLEFVEVGCDLTSLDLSDYTLVFFNGGHAVNGSYFALHLGGNAPNEITSPDGRLLAGCEGLPLPPRPSHRWADNLLQNGADAVALYQGRPEDYPAGTPPTQLGLIDAVVYGTRDPDDTLLLQALLGTGPQALQPDEDAHGRKDSESLQRVSPERLDGRAFLAAPATPWFLLPPR